MNSNEHKGVVMPMVTTVQMWGNSLGIRIPKKIAEMAGTRVGTTFDISVEDEKIILEPIDKPPTLEELLAKVRAENRHTEIDFGEPKGNELI